MQKKMDANGVTLIELIVAMVVMTILIVGMLSVFRQIMTQRHINERRVFANYLARMIMEREMARPYEQLTDQARTNVAAAFGVTSPADVDYEIKMFCLQEDFNNSQIFVDPESTSDWADVSCEGYSGGYKRMELTIYQDALGEQMQMHSIVSESDGLL